MAFAASRQAELINKSGGEVTDIDPAYAFDAERDVAYFMTTAGELYRRETAGSEAVLLAVGVTLFSLSPNGEWLAMRRTPSETNHELYAMPAAGGEENVLIPDWGLIKYLDAIAFTDDSEYVLTSYEQDNGLPMQLLKLPLEGGEVNIVMAAEEYISYRYRALEVQGYGDGRYAAVKLLENDTSHPFYLIADMDEKTYEVSPRPAEFDALRIVDQRYLEMSAVEFEKQPVGFRDPMPWDVYFNARHDGSDWQQFRLATPVRFEERGSLAFIENNRVLYFDAAERQKQVIGAEWNSFYTQAVMLEASKYDPVLIYARWKSGFGSYKFVQLRAIYFQWRYDVVVHEWMTAGDMWVESIGPAEYLITGLEPGDDDSLEDIYLMKGPRNAVPHTVFDAYKGWN